MFETELTIRYSSKDFGLFQSTEQVLGYCNEEVVFREHTDKMHMDMALYCHHVISSKVPVLLSFFRLLSFYSKLSPGLVHPLRWFQTSCFTLVCKPFGCSLSCHDSHFFPIILSVPDIRFLQHSIIRSSILFCRFNVWLQALCFASDLVFGVLQVLLQLILVIFLPSKEEGKNKLEMYIYLIFNTANYLPKPCTGLHSITYIWLTSYIYKYNDNISSNLTVAWCLILQKVRKRKYILPTGGSMFCPSPNHFKRKRSYE